MPCLRAKDLLYDCNSTLFNDNPLKSQYYLQSFKSIALTPSNYGSLNPEVVERYY